MSTRSTNRRVAPAAAKVKTQVTVSVQTYDRLIACAAVEGKSLGEIVDKLTEERLSGYYAANRGEPLWPKAAARAGRAASVTNDDRRESTDDVSLAAGTAA